MDNEDAVNVVENTILYLEVIRLKQRKQKTKRKKKEETALPWQL